MKQNRQQTGKKRAQNSMYGSDCLARNSA